MSSQGWCEGSTYMWTSPTTGPPTAHDRCLTHRGCAVRYPRRVYTKVRAINSKYQKTINPDAMDLKGNMGDGRCVSLPFSFSSLESHQHPQGRSWLMRGAQDSGVSE